MNTFKTNTDCFGIPKQFDVEVSYEFDPFDGDICISEITLIRKTNYNKKGDFDPHTEELSIDAAWLSNQTLDDLACEISESLLADKIDNENDLYDERMITHYFDNA